MTLPLELDPKEARPARQQRDKNIGFAFRSVLENPCILYLEIPSQTTKLVRVA
jgi:hypothetical protein